MQTQLEQAKAGHITPQIETVAVQENWDPEIIRPISLKERSHHEMFTEGS